MSKVSRAKFGRLAFLILAAAALVLVVVGSTLAFRDTTPSDTEKVLPGRVERLQGTNVNRVILTVAAVKRLGIVTQTIRDDPAAARKVMPYAAVLYDASGATWTYINPEPLVFVREPVTVDAIRGDQAVLSAGPAAGTPVVTVGAIELYGTEFGVSGDE
jgi:hypothetical protein